VLVAAVGVAVLGVVLPLTPVAAALRMQAPPPVFFGFLAAIVCSYLLAAQWVKSVYHHGVGR
jgi:Mg2+-importing ATPase